MLGNCTSTEQRALIDQKEIKSIGYYLNKILEIKNKIICSNVCFFDKCQQWKFDHSLYVHTCNEIFH